MDTQFGTVEMYSRIQGTYFFRHPGDETQSPGEIQSSENLRINASIVMYNLGDGPRLAYVSASARHQNNKLLW